LTSMGCVVSPSFSLQIHSQDTPARYTRYTLVHTVDSVPVFQFPYRRSVYQRCATRPGPALRTVLGFVGHPHSELEAAHERESVRGGAAKPALSSSSGEEQVQVHLHAGEIQLPRGRRGGELAHDARQVCRAVCRRAQSPAHPRPHDTLSWRCRGLGLSMHHQGNL
jgi:hypothetical protein